MKKGWVWGWKTKTWLNFENKVSFEETLSKLNWYRVEDHTNVFFNDKKIAEIYQKHWLYKKLLIPKGIDFKKIISKQLLPDNAIYVISKWTLFIIEIKYQEVDWSVDEKLQTCEFKKLQYERLLKPLKLKVEYCYVLSKWFCNSKYIDVLNYIQAKWCSYYFEELPLDYLWLPNPLDE